jgi:hypothetical protein
MPEIYVRPSSLVILLIKLFLLAVDGESPWKHSTFTIIMI